MSGTTAPENDSSKTLLDRLAAELARDRPGPPGACAGALLRLLHARTQASSLQGRDEAQLKAQALSLLELLEQPFNGFRVRVSSPKGGHTFLESAGPDQPFLLDSLLELLRVRGHNTTEVLHPIVAVVRDGSGRPAALAGPGGAGEIVSTIRIELDRHLAASQAEKLAREAEGVLEEARRVALDFNPMLDRVTRIEAELRTRLERLEPGPEHEEIKEGIAFLGWLRRANFIFLGYRSYDVTGEGQQAMVEVEHGSGLGILRAEERSTFATAKPLSSLPADQTERLLAPGVILVHKANSDSHVARRARMDYIGIKKLDQKGRVTGEHRFLGLFTSRAYNDLPSDIPILRKKLEEIYARAGVVPGSHDHKVIFSVFTSIPKHELFLLESAQIGEMIAQVMASSGRREVKVSYRLDSIERGVSVMVLMPKEKFSADVRIAVQKLLADELKGTLVDYRLALGEEPNARLHFYFITRQGLPPSDAREALEGKVAQLVRTWAERLTEVLAAELGPAEGERLGAIYRKAFPAPYVAVKSPDTAVADLRNIESVLASDRLHVSIASLKQAHARRVSVLKLYRPREPFALSTLMPILTHLGLHVLDEQTFRVAPEGAPCEVFVHSFRVLAPGDQPIPTGKVARFVEETIPAVLAGEIEDDGLNALVLRAALDRRQVDLLRAYTAYLLQLGSSLSRRTIYNALNEAPNAAAALVQLFELRFDPALKGERAARTEAAAAELRSHLEKVQGILADQILRNFEGLIRATVRTSYFQLGADGKPRPALALKLRCAEVPNLPEPRPLYEIFVHCAQVEGVHLRSGKVARGGIRWSSRPDDYRMEILGLMKAQRTKNAVIVPVGAKGGFLLKRASSASPPPAEIRQHYQTFIGALFDVTDNLVGGAVVHPANVVVHDEEDPYLVVAADRGTAALSDTANSIAAERHFWLGDAFASGGSRGYNHKKEGITARGAWECVRRHFCELGIDMDSRPFTATGIGDMSGDVFGNGMIYAPTLRLVAAFNHAHIFIDPDPPQGAFEERKRLFSLPTSQWTDYRAELVSPGGGIYRRDAKAISLSPRAREVLGCQRETLNGDELVRAILMAPVDLLFNGGIGTYIKSRMETHQDVSDPTNNNVRVDGADVRARVVAEGGNLGATQLGRIEYARSGGRCNTDFIDNSAGVDLSDHEVNLKILLARAIDRGALPAPERDPVLSGVTGAVCDQVLRDNYLQAQALSLEVRRGVRGLEEHRYLIEELSREGLLNRAVERIPSDAELLRLRDSRLGLTRPQVSVLLAYSKIDAYARIVASHVPDEPDFLDLALGYFPPQIAARFSEDVKGHRLRKEIVATVAVNQAINAMGVAFFHETARRTGAAFEEILKAWRVASELCEARAVEAAVDRLFAAGTGDCDALYELTGRLRAAVSGVTDSILRTGLGAPTMSEALERHRGRILVLEAARPRAALPAGPQRIPEKVERALAAAERAVENLDLAVLVEDTGASPEDCLRAWDQAGEVLYLGRLEAEAARVVQVTSEDIQTCASLLEEARRHRKRLVRNVLAQGREGGARVPLEKAAGLAPGAAREAARALALLEAARTREPLTPAGLYVVVEALGRMLYP